MNRLPHEILVNIFSYLPTDELTCSLQYVCRHWEKLVSNSSFLWNRIDLSLSEIPTDCFYELINFLPVVKRFIKRMSIEENRLFPIIELRRIKFQNLISLSIRLYSGEMCDMIVKKMPHLKDLDLCLKDCIHDEFILPFDLDTCLKKFSVYSLQRFRITCCFDLVGISFDESIHKFIKSQIHLKELSLIISGIHYLTETSASDIFQLCTNLTKFEIRDISNCLTDSVFTHLKQHLKLLELRIKNNDTLSDKGLKALAERAKELKVVSLEMVENITSDGLLHISKNCCNLEKLVIGGGIDDRISGGLVHIAAGCPKLKSLHYMDLFYSKDIQIISVSQLCKYLQILIITDCPYLTDQSLFSLADNGRSLVKILLSGSEFFTIYGVVALVLSCNKLEYLRFNYCKSIGEIDINDTENKTVELYSNRVKSNQQKYSALQILNFDGCKKCSNITIQQIAPFCPKLKFVFVRDTCVHETATLERHLNSNCKILFDNWLPN